MTKIIETCYIKKKIPKKLFAMLKDTQNCPFPLTQRCARPEETRLGSAEQE